MPKSSTDTEMVDSDPPCPCENCTGPVQSSALPQTPSGKQKKKRYEPPRPDENTFETQQEFLDSLHSIPIEDVETDSHRCSHCWKFYGEEADPGQDNSEEPVKLRCGHTFGNKCLRQMFDLPGTSEFALRPLTFTSGSEGHALYRKLDTFAAQHGRNFRNNVETFTKMLQESYAPAKGPQLFGDHWWFILQHLQQTAEGMSRVTLLDNAVVMDRKQSPPRRTRSSLDKAVVQSGALGVSGIDLNKTLSESVKTTAEVIPPVSTPPVSTPPVSTPPALTGGNEHMYNDYSPALDEMINSSKSQTPSKSPPVSSWPAGMQPAPPFKSPFDLQQTPPQQAFEQSITAGPSPTWGEVLATQSYLDKLIAAKQNTENKLGELSGSPKQPSPYEQQAIEQPQDEQKKAYALSVKQREEYMKSQRKALDKEQRRMKRAFISLLAKELARIYNEGNDCDPATDLRDPSELNLVSSTILVHSNEQRTSYEIQPSWQKHYSWPYPHDDESETDDNDEDDKATSIRMMPFITRATCTNCCREKPEVDLESLEMPTSLWWKKPKKVLDSCPICRSILFKKDRPFQSRRLLMQGMVDDEMSDGSMD